MRVANGLRWTRAILPDSVSLGIDIFHSLSMMCVLSDRWRRRCHNMFDGLVVCRLGRWLICTLHSARCAFISGLGIRMSSNGCN